MTAARPWKRSDRSAAAPPHAVARRNCGHLPECGMVAIPPAAVRTMPRRRSKSSHLAQQFAELAWAAPQVVAARTARMALAGASPSRRDQAEFLRMGSEKVEAFYRSWGAMWVAAWAAPFEIASAATTSNAGAIAVASQSALGVLSAGLEPVHRRAVSNARRLSRGRR